MICASSERSERRRRYPLSSILSGLCFSSLLLSLPLAYEIDNLRNEIDSEATKSTIGGNKTDSEATKPTVLGNEIDNGWRSLIRAGLPLLQKESAIVPCYYE